VQAEKEAEEKEAVKKAQLQAERQQQQQLPAAGSMGSGSSSSCQDPPNRFDPETGEPLNHHDPSDRFDPETGKPLTGNDALVYGSPGEIAIASQVAASMLVTNETQQQESAPPAPPPSTARLTGRLQVKLMGSVFGSSWLDADCLYNPATTEFAYASLAGGKGRQERVGGCWILDVENRPGKKQHRFDVHSRHRVLGSAAVISVAASTEEEKQRWTAAMLSQGDALDGK
jgi:hypothetical protein